MTSGRSLRGADTIGDYAYYLNHWNGSHWSVIDSSRTDDPALKFTAGLWSSPSRALYSTLLGVYKRRPDETSWERILTTKMPVQLAISSDENIFAMGDNWEIHHWNGSDWITVATPLSGFGYFTCGWTDNHETFLVGIDGRKTYIMHGK